MRTIHKFRLEPGVTRIKMPTRAHVLSVHEQDGEAYLWAMVDPDREPRKIERVFFAAGTGHMIPDGQMQFIGAVHLEGGTLVFHIFEVLS